MATLIEEFRDRRQVVLHLNQHEAKFRLTGFIDWLESHDQIRKILQNIKSNTDLKAILAGCEKGFPPSATTPKEIAAVGIYIMEECRRANHIYRLVYYLGIAPTHRSAGTQDYVDEANERYIQPAIDYIERHIIELLEASNVDNLINGRVNSLFSSSFEERFPDTAAHIRKITSEFLKSEEEGTWFNIGNSCREALIAFTQEIRQSVTVEIPDSIKSSDVKNTINHVIETLGNDNRFQETLKKLIASVWDHVQPVIHRTATTREEAMPAFTWTALSILELYKLITNRR